MKHPLHKLLISNRGTAGRRIDVRAGAAPGEAEVFLYDAIVADELEAEWMGGVAPQQFVPMLRDLQARTIHLRINSPGGSVFAARAIEQALREHPARIVAHIDGLAASAATFIAMAADEIIIAPGSLFMIHNAWGAAMGNAADMLDMATLLEKIDGTLVHTYAARTGQSAEQLRGWMAAETWFDADEAVAAKFADRIADDGAAPQAGAIAWDLSAYAHAPERAITSAPAAPTEPEPQPIDAAAYLRRLAVAALPA